MGYTEIRMKRLGSAWDRKLSRRIHGPEVEQGKSTNISTIEGAI